MAVAYYTLQLTADSKLRSPSSFSHFCGAAVLAARVLLDLTDGALPEYAEQVQAMALYVRFGQEDGDTLVASYRHWLAARILGPSRGLLRRVSRVYRADARVLSLHGVRPPPPAALLREMRLEEAKKPDAVVEEEEAAPPPPQASSPHADDPPPPTLLRLVDAPRFEFDPVSDHPLGGVPMDREATEALLLYRARAEEAGLTSEDGPVVDDHLVLDDEAADCVCPLQREMRRRSEEMLSCTRVSLDAHITQMLVTSRCGSPGGGDDLIVREACCERVLAMVSEQRAHVSKVSSDAKQAFHRWERDQEAAVRLERRKARSESERRRAESAACALREAEEAKCAEKVRLVENALRLSRQRFDEWETTGCINALTDSVSRAKKGLDDHAPCLPASRADLREDLLAHWERARRCLTERRAEMRTERRRPETMRQQPREASSSPPSPSSLSTAPSSTSHRNRKKKPPSSKRGDQPAAPIVTPIATPSPAPDAEKKASGVSLVRLSDLPASCLSSRPESSVGGDTTCIVCFASPKTHLAAPCAHQCVCGPCSAKLQRCPYCRADVKIWVELHAPVRVV